MTSSITSLDPERSKSWPSFLCWWRNAGAVWWREVVGQVEGPTQWDFEVRPTPADCPRSPPERWTPATSHPRRPRLPPAVWERPSHVETGSEDPDAVPDTRHCRWEVYDVRQRTQCDKQRCSNVETRPVETYRRVWIVYTSSLAWEYFNPLMHKVAKMVT